MKFNIGLSFYIIGNIKTTDLPGLAVKALEEGYDTPSLRILAGLKEDVWDIMQHLNFTLKELNLKLPNTKEAKLIIFEYYLNEIVNNNINPIVGLKLIITKINCIPILEVSNLYGLYYQYDDLINSNIITEKYRNRNIPKVLSQIVDESEKRLKNFIIIKEKLLNNNDF